MTSIKRHNNVITIWQMSAVEVAALFKKNYINKWKVWQKKNLSWVWGVDRKLLLLIQEGQLSVSGERMCTILVNRLED